MPGSTPVYGFTYPCPGETISPMAFQILANQIDAKLLDLQADYILMLNRRNYDSATSPAQVIAAGADTVLTSPLVTYVTPIAGLYIVRARAAGNPAGTVNMRRIRVRQNAVVRFGTTANTENNTFCQPVAIGPINAAAGDTITLTYLFNGTVTESVTAELDIKLLVRTA